MNTLQVTVSVILLFMVIIAFLFSSYIQLLDYMERTDKNFADILRGLL